MKAGRLPCLRAGRWFFFDPEVINEAILWLAAADARVPPSPPIDAVQSNMNVDRKNLPTLAGIRLPVRFMLLTNELPNMRDASGALITRVILLRLTRSFTGKEDRGLLLRLLGELPGVLNWAIHGLKGLNARGHFQQPESGRELLEDLDELASPITSFVRDRCIVGPEFSVPIGALFSEWKSWCETHGRDHPGTCEAFGKDLRAAVPTLRRTKPRLGGERVPTCEGIGLRESGPRWSTDQSYVHESSFQMN